MRKREVARKMKTEMHREEAVNILCKHLWIYEELAVRKREPLPQEYFEARDKLIPEYRSKMAELQQWWIEQE